MRETMEEANHRLVHHNKLVSIFLQSPEVGARLPDDPWQTAPGELVGMGSGERQGLGGV